VGFRVSALVEEGKAKTIIAWDLAKTHGALGRKWQWRRRPSSNTPGELLGVRDHQGGTGGEGQSLGCSHDRRGSSERVAPGGDSGGDRAWRQAAGFWCPRSLKRPRRTWSGPNHDRRGSWERVALDGNGRGGQAWRRRAEEAKLEGDRLDFERTRSSKRPRQKWSKLGTNHDRRGSSERVAPGDDGGGGRARRRPAGFFVSALTLEAEAKIVRVRDPATTGRVLQSEWLPTATVEAAKLGGNRRAFG